MTDQIKPVRAWACVDRRTPHIDPNDIHDTKRDAKAFRTISERVIPVTITPGHEAEDET